MRSLWRVLALRWLGGVGSQALEGESNVLELLFGEPARGVPRTFDVRREPSVSHRAMMSPGAAHRSAPAIATAEVTSAEWPSPRDR
jgi:hypothetical protein